MSNNQKKLTDKDFKDPYEYGFETDIESDFAPKGLNEETVKFISNKKNEPEWLLNWRLEAYEKWLTMKEPDWSSVRYPKICLLYTSPSPRDRTRSRMPSSA